MQPQIRLDIDTGNGNYSIAGNAGVLSASFQPILDIALRGRTINDFHGERATDAASRMDDAIDSLRRGRNDYLGLTEPQFALRPQVEAYLVGWRDLCRKHPNCTVSIVP